MAKHAKELKQLLEELREQGWIVTLGRRHYRLEHNSGQGLVFCSQSPSDWRVFEKIRQDCKRALKG